MRATPHRTLDLPNPRRHLLPVAPLVSPHGLGLQRVLLCVTTGCLRLPRLPVHRTLRLSPEIKSAAFPTTNALNTHIEKHLSTGLTTTYTSEFAFPIELISQDGALSIYQVSIPAAPSFCRDHFPGRPLLPAYAILFFIRHTLHQTLNLKPEGWSWQQVKFSRPLLPNAQLTLEINPSDAAIQIKLRQQGAICFSGRFVAQSSPCA